jgi:hypothetical protein
MEPEFEILPFQGEGEDESLEEERGRTMAGRRPPMRSAYKVAPRKWPGPPRRPRWPAGGGWPFTPVLVEPWPAPQPEPEPEPVPDADPDADADAAQQPGQDEFGWHAEMPATLKATLGGLAATERPDYADLGSFAAALRDARSNKPGLYLIEFTVAGRARAYSGKSRNVRRRLQQHLLCATMLGLSVSGHRVFVAPLANLSPGQLRDIEKRIHTDMFANHRGVLTNQRRELEAELLGAGWR